MEKELIETLNGFRIYAVQDDDARNPFIDMDTNPPILTFSNRSVTGYGKGKWEDYAITAHDFLPLVSCKKCKEIFADLAGDADVKYYVKEYGNARDGLAEYVARDAIDRPRYWSEAEKYFDLLEELANAAKIPCYNGVVTGYSKGDATRVFVALTPATIKVWGNSPAWVKEHGAKSAEATADLYAAWAFGDIYGYEILEVIPGDEDEDGEEREDDTGESCWGYYGTDHEKSGLLEAARDAVAFLVEEREREALEAHDAACRDIVTV